MPRPLLLLALVALAAPAHAADRTYVVTNFDRIRVDGAFVVQVEVGSGGATASASGDDRALDALDISVEGTTLTVRKGGQNWGEQGKLSAPAPVVILRAPAIRGATVIGGGKLMLTGTIRTQRLDIQVMGAGTIDASGIDAEDVTATMVGTGNVSLAGRTLRARYATNGSGTIAATALDAGDVLVTLDGPGETRAGARYNADLTNKGVGLIAIAGNPHCVVRGRPTGPVQCGPGVQSQ